MKAYDIYHHSYILDRDMNMKVYGHFGLPIIIFPCQDGNEYDSPSHGMIDTLSDYIEAGIFKVYCVTSIDQESWSSTSWDKYHRSWMVDQYYEYIINEVLPLIYEDCRSHVEPLVMGFSMGANHASTMFFRRPELFSGIIALSGVYNATDFFFESWCDERLYNNTPLLFLKNIPYDHYFLDIYREKKMYFCSGTGAWEESSSHSLSMLNDVFKEKNIPAYVDFWGGDVAHDWPWWKIQVRYFLDKFLNS